LSSSIALADGASTLERARASYEELRYDEASALLEAALDGGELDALQRREALLLAGIVEVIRGEDERASARFRELLEEAPDVTLPSGLSPKITRVFDEVRRRLEAERAQREPRDPAPTNAADGDAPQDLVAASAQPAEAASPSSAGAVSEAEDDGLSSIALGVAAGAAVAAAVVVASAGALLFFARGQPPESSLGTMQLP
jgi:hypothetical protein